MAKAKTPTLLEAATAELTRQETLEAQKRERAEAERRRAETDQTVAAVRARCRSLSQFVQEAWHVLEPNATYVHGWHIEAICLMLELVTLGRITRLRINVPPGSMKSLLVSVFWPAWEWGPMGLWSLRYLSTAHNEDPVKRDARKTRDLILSEWYQTNWPEVHLIRTAEMSFANDRTGNREGIPFASLTSQRGDRLIIDDPNPATQMYADRIRTARDFREGAVNRLNDQQRSAIVLIQQRTDMGDVSGTIEQFGMKYVNLILPMEFEPERRCSVILDGEIVFEDPRTYDGELLDPVRFPREACEELKTKEMGPYGWAGQYQQRPSPRGGGMFKVGLIEPIEALPTNIVKAVRAWDFGASIPKPGTDPDYTVGIKLLRDEAGAIYIADIRRDRLDAAGVETLVGNTAKMDGGNVRIRYPQDPGQAGKAQAARFSRILAGYPFTCLPVTGDKVTRADPAAAQVSMGNVKILVTDENRAVVEAFLDELAAFNGGRHDDQVDAFADGVSELCGTIASEGIFEFYRQEAAKLQAEASGEQREVASDEWWELLPPQSIGVAYGRTGATYTKDGNGVMKVHPDDAPAFLSQIGWRRRAPVPVGG